MADKPVVYVLVGATASGKTEVAVELAKCLGAELGSLDSMKVYRGMNVGTAKPEIKGAECQDGSAEKVESRPQESSCCSTPPFSTFSCSPALPAKPARWHCLDLAEPDEDFNVGRWLAAADAAIAEAHARGVPLVFEGGAPLYCRALLYGLFAGPPRDAKFRAELRRRAEAEGVEALHAELAQADPAAAARIQKTDLRRIERALEVFHLTGRPISGQQRQFGRPRAGFDFRAAGVERDRRELYARIDARFEAMLAAGFLEEVRALLARPGRLSAGALQALGYRELARHLAGELPLEEAVRLAQRNTRHFARRQLSGFKKIPGIEWFRPEPGESAAALAARIAARLR